MTRTLAFIAAAALALSLAGAADAQKIDKNGRCHGADGKFAKMEVCKPAAAAKPSHCRDPKSGKFESCAKPGAVPIPDKK
jgi:hypothetical protein